MCFGGWKEDFDGGGFLGRDGFEGDMLSRF